MYIAESKEIILFEDEKGRRPFATWFKSLNNSTKSIISQRLVKVARGNYGDYKILKKVLKNCVLNLVQDIEFTLQNMVIK